MAEGEKTPAERLFESARDGDLAALRLQRAKCTDIGEAPRYVRLFFGGDWMSIGDELHEEFNARAEALTMMVQESYKAFKY